MNARNTNHTVYGTATQTRRIALCVCVLVCDGGVLCCNPRRNLDDRLLLAACVLHSLSLSFFLQASLPVSRLNPICQHVQSTSSMWNIFCMVSRVRNGSTFSLFTYSAPPSVSSAGSTPASVLAACFITQEASCPRHNRGCDSISCPFPQSRTSQPIPGATSIADGFLLNPEIKRLWWRTSWLTSLAPIDHVAVYCPSEALTMMDATT